jgi:hypothetical protein
MDRDQLDSDVVHQVFLGYGSAGMGALKSSLPDRSLLSQWEQDLVHYVRLQPIGTIDPPSCSFTYITSADGRAAIVRRVREGDTLGRNNGHALVGAAAVLGPLALELTHAFSWAATSEKMSPESYSPAELREIVSSGVSVSDSNDLDRCKDSARRILGCVLETPFLDVSLIGLEHHLIIPTLELFEAVLKPVFNVEPPTRNWSFSSYEERDTDRGGSFQLPELIFLPEVPSHAGETRHHRILLSGSTPGDPKYHKLAERLIERYFRLGHDDYVDAVDKIAQANSVEARIRALFSESYHVPTKPDPVLRVVGRPPEQWYHAVATSCPPSTPSQPHSPSTTSTQATGEEQPAGEQPGHSPLTSPNDRQLVLRLQQAGGWYDVNAAVSLLRKNIPAIPDKKRWRHISDPKVLDKIDTVLDPWESRNAYAGLLEFAFGDPAERLRRREYFDWVASYLKKMSAEKFLFFDCTIFSLVEGSAMESQCRRLLRERWQGVSSIPLAAHDDRETEGHPRNLRHRTSGQLVWFRNHQMVIVSILVYLTFIVIIAVTLATR